MRCKRKQTNRFHVTLDEQQRQALLQLKSIDGTKSRSDSDKGDSMSSEYFPMEDEDSEEDKIEVVGLLSDEIDEERVRVKRKRVQRNQAGESTFKRKTMRVRNPAIEHKSGTRTSCHQTTPDAGMTLKVEPPRDMAKSSVGSVVNIPATTKSASILASPGSSSSQEMEHLSGSKQSENKEQYGKQEDAALNAKNDSKRVVKAAVELLEQIAEWDDEDLLEAETESLDDDEVDTYDGSLGGGSGNGVSESNPLEKSSWIADGDSLSHKPGGAASETETVHRNETAPAPTSEVQHFFDFAPRKRSRRMRLRTNFDTRFISFSVGSNGLRRSRKTIGSPSINNGKSIPTRRCIQLLEEVPVAKGSSRKVKIRW
ncbi:hypothetical protein PsorP6_015215 [Peronosclerospora sorghi]|uniref:Uncharacterized protein n=1 Tax=Peronosclerospora sorghi TaxID=230839 RepID=A0ACC0VU62_9STRA|nr:hypothetical protein PsorP6_015215 [Peronosclerospora sorghi]